MKEGFPGEGDPLEHVVVSIDKAVGMLLKDPVLLRPLYQVMLGLTDPVHHPRFLSRAFTFYRGTLDFAVERKLIEEEEQTMLACSMMAHFMGVLDLWVHEDIDDTGFRAQISYGIAHLLWPYARGKSLEQLRKRFEAAKGILKKKKNPKFLGHDVHRQGKIKA